MNEKQSADLNRFKSVLDTYGSSRKSWPESDIPMMDKLLGNSDVARSLLRQEEKFDFTVTAPNAALQAPSALLSRVLSDAQRETSGSLLPVFWPFGSIWQPASGLVMAAFVGALLGISSPNLLEEYDSASYDEPAFNDTLFDLEYENGNV